MDKNDKKAQKRYKKDHNMHIQFEPRFAAGDYVFVGHLPANGIYCRLKVYKGDSKLLSHYMGPYQAIRTGPEYAKIYQYVIPNTVSINRLTWLARVESLKKNASESKANTGRYSTGKPSREEEKNICAFEKVF